MRDGEWAKVVSGGAHVTARCQGRRPRFASRRSTSGDAHSRPLVRREPAGVHRVSRHVLLEQPRPMDFDSGLAWAKIKTYASRKWRAYGARSAR